MKKLIIFLCLVTSIVTAQVKTIDLKYYTVHYNESYPGPVMVEYTISKVTTPDSIKRKDDWNRYPGIKQPKANDWKSTGFDKGHLAPAETFSQTHEKIQSTFSYLNCSFQHNKLNRTTWRALEKAELDWARTDSLKVYVGCLYRDPNKVTKTGSVIPTHFWRVVINHTNKTYIAFLFENKEVVFNYNKGVIKLADLDKKYGIKIETYDYKNL